MTVMPHTYICAHVHYVFSTKNRAHLIPVRVQPDLWAYIGGIARADAAKALAVGGTENHVHVLLGMPSIIAIATAVQRIKDASSRWLHEEHGLDCEWQEGYGAFTVSASQLPRTIEYISSQPEHHRRLRFEDEFVALLKKHRIAYDPKFVFG
jgi:putative transposase